jgi:predicted phage terminase large subunit-like protein
LCPERYPVEKLRKYERRLGSYFWGALFQQHPKPRAGLMFQREWFTVVDVAPREAKRVRYWDKAGTQGGGKATAGVLMARDAEGVFYVEHVVRGQYSALERERVIRQTAEADDAQYGGVEIWMEQEPGSGGKESAENTVRGLAGFKVHKETVIGDKVTRAEPFAAQCEARNVRLVRGAWNGGFLDELTAFPHGAFADQVDGSSGAFNKLTGSGRKIAQVR